MRRRIMFIAALLLTCGVWVAFIFARNARNDSIQQYAQLQNQVESLEAESNELQRMIEHTRSESQKELHSTATAEYLILDLDERLYSEVYEIMKPRDIPGVMLLGRQWPGDKDCITEEEFEALLDDGWSYVLCWSEEEDWLEDAQEHLDDLELDLPEALFFPDGTFSQEAAEEAEDFSIFIHHGEEDVDSGDGAWYLDISAWNYSGVRRDTRTVVEQAENRAFEVSLSEDGDSAYAEKAFVNCMDNIEAYVEEDSLTVTGFEAALELRREEEERNAEITAQAEELIAGYQARIEEIQQEISAVYQR